MKNEKELNEICEAQNVSEENLESITGGNSPGYQITNSSTYSSGNAPKYKVGDKVEVKYIPLHFSQNERWLSFYVTDVSTEKNGGLLCKEFTYSLKDTGEGNRVLTGVYESCMRRAQ